MLNLFLYFVQLALTIGDWSCDRILATKMTTRKVPGTIQSRQGFLYSSLRDLFVTERRRSLEILRLQLLNKNQIVNFKYGCVLWLVCEWVFGLVSEWVDGWHGLVIGQLYIYILYP